MLRIALAVIVGAALAGGARAAPPGSCDDMVASFDAYLKAHPNATGALPQTVGAQLMHQPTAASLAAAKKQGRAHLEALLAKAKAEQKAHDEGACRATLGEVRWMLKP
jgi:hypothetical protein